MVEKIDAGIKYCVPEIHAPKFRVFPKFGGCEAYLSIEKQRIPLLVTLLEQGERSQRDR